MLNNIALTAAYIMCQAVAMLSFSICVRMVDMRMDSIMIENMILTMSRYFILKKIGR